MLSLPYSKYAVPAGMLVTVATLILCFIFVDLLGMDERRYWTVMLVLLLLAYCALQIYGFVAKPNLRIVIAHINIFILSGLLAIHLYLSHLPVPRLLYLPVAVSFIRLVIWVIKGK
jgi:hypothetical protein